MSAYLWLKLLHILGATVILGTGAGIAFFMLSAHLSKNREAFSITARSVVLADWLFTTPAIILQFATGLWLTSTLGIPYGLRLVCHRGRRIHCGWPVLVAGGVHPDAYPGHTGQGGHPGGLPTPDEAMGRPGYSRVYRGACAPLSNGK